MCRGKTDFETAEGIRVICDARDDAGSVNVTEIVIVGLVGKYVRSLGIKWLLSHSHCSKENQNALFVAGLLLCCRAAASCSDSRASRCLCGAVKLFFFFFYLMIAAKNCSIDENR